MNIKKLIPFIVFSAVGLLVFILTLVSLLVPWYTIESTTSTLAGVEMCKATQTQSWDLEVVESSGVNCTNLPNGQSRNWRDTCEYDFCRNKAAVFIITRGLLAYAATGTLLALIVYLVGAFGPGVAYQVHASAAVVFCVGLCSLLPLALAVFLFGIGLTAGVHQDQVDYVASSNAGDGLVYDRETTACQLDVSCTSLAGEGTFTRPCFTVPFGCFATYDRRVPVDVAYKWGTAAGFPIAVIATLLALATVPTMAIFGLRKKKASLLDDDWDDDADLDDK